jgi:hypothetical protein
MEVSETLRLLKEKPEDRSLVVILVIGLLGLIVSYILFAPLFAALAPSGYSIVDQQTVFTYEANERILAAWKGIEGGIQASLMSAYVDLFPFMPAYAAVGFAWGTLVARRFSGKAWTVGIVCSLCIFPAWFADVIETGIQAIISLNVDSYPPSLVPVMSSAAVVKAALFRATVVWCLVGTLLLIVVRVRGRGKANCGE